MGRMPPATLGMNAIQDCRNCMGHNTERDYGLEHLREVAPPGLRQSHGDGLVYGIRTIARKAAGGSDNFLKALLGDDHWGGFLVGQHMLPDLVEAGPGAGQLSLVSSPEVAPEILLLV